MMQDVAHIPVLRDEMLSALALRDGEIYVDATFGAGGYSRAMLESAKCRVFAIDRDPSTIMLADALARGFPGHFFFLAGCFGDMVSLLAQHGVSEVDGIVMDIGVSSMQIDSPERGFSFRSEGPLDMRMGSSGMSAADVVNTLDEGELADIIYQYGEEKKSRKIARAIVNARPIHTTQQLADVVRSVVRATGPTDPATRTFQALRIHVNDELGELQRALDAATQLLKPGGRLVVVTFHSLEDRIVKQFFSERSHGELPGVSRHLPYLPAADVATPVLFSLQKRQPISASSEEIAHNPRARSAKLRVGIRTDEKANARGGGA